MPSNRTRQIRVIHVDDEPNFLEMAATFLEREDDRFSVETATSADEGLERITDRPPDCIVSDYNMPGVDGLEFLQAVREQYPELPFILFTGRGSEEVASEAIAADVTDYLQKGSGTERYELLCNRIANAVRAQRETQRADRQEELMRLTEFAGDTGGFEIDVDTGDVILTDGTRRLVGLPEDADLSLEDAIALYHPDHQADVREAVDQAVETGEQTRGTWCIQTPGGDERFLDVTITPVASDGETAKLRGAAHDVTDYRERQRELRLLQRAIDSANVPITLADPSKADNPLVYVNDAFEEMTGYRPAEALGENCRFLQGEDTDPEKVAAIGDAIDNEEPITVELRNYRKDGTEFWNRLTLTPIYDDDKLVRYLGTQGDITERRERERELEEEQRFTEQALDTLDDLFYVLDTDGTIQRWNRRVPEITGYTDQELTDMPADEAFPESERAAIADGVERALADGRASVKAELLTAEGERLPCEFTGARLTDEDGRVTGLVGVGRDLTDRRRRERRFRMLLEESNEVVSIVDADEQFEYQSPSVGRILGYGPEERINDTMWEYIHPDDHDRVRETLETVAASMTPESVEYRARHADGSNRWMAARISVHQDGSATGNWVINSREITEQKRHERDLEEYETIVQALPDAVYVLDEEGRFTHVNDELVELVGYERETVLGSTSSLFKDEEAVDGAEHQLGRLLSSDGPETATFEVMIQPREGDPIVCEDHMGVLPFDGEEFDGSVGTLRDITQRKEYERTLEAHNENLDEFASIVSHDLRSPLGVAMGHLELASETHESEHLLKASNALERCEALIKDLLTLAREGNKVGETESVDLAEVAESSWRTVEVREATLEAGGLDVIEVDRSRVQQLLENLYRNAIEHGHDAVTVHVGIMKDGFYVADNGPGIPDSEREDVFEAGYSTAEEGTGFGLRIVEQIADAHGWEVTVTGSEQGGARFEFTGCRGECHGA